MRLHTLTVTAFGPFATTQRVDFDTLSAAGLFLLHGPTGAGKTSVLDAVCFALYGSVPGARRQAPQALRSDHAAPHTPTEVILDLTLGGRRLEVTRRPEQTRPKKRGTGTTRDKPVSLLREWDRATGAWRALSRSHQEIGEELGGLLGMSRDQFCQVVLLPQGDFARFLRANAEDRGKLLGRLFDTRRFAAAEQRLAELRADATQRVRAGDERLLATAHRVTQAAGAPPELADHPPPDALPPGDPHLADAVLTWAALARCAARERQDATALALRAAEAAHDRAQHRLADTVERARRQHRHADAQRRAAELARQRPARERDQARLEQARAADAVAPALALRDTAQQAEAAAAATERAARAALPPTLAEAPAAHLADEERRTRTRLGTLAAARADEERAARLDAELAELARAAEADAEPHHAAERRLADAEADRARLTARIEAADAAHTRAEQAAAQLEPAAARLAAARRRDALATRLGEAEAALRTAREEATAATEHWLDLKERRLRGIAAELAAGLSPGQPCAVCGCTTHPRPARPAPGHVASAEEDAAWAAHEEATGRRERAERERAAAHEAHAAAAAEAGDGRTAELAATVASHQATLDAARRAAADAEPARAALAAAERRHADTVAARQRAHSRAAARDARRDTLRAEREALAHTLAQARGPAATVADRAAALERTAEALAAAAEAARAAEEAAHRLKEADAGLADAAYRAGFPTPGAAAEAVLPEATQRELRARCDAWQAEETAVAEALADPHAAAAAAEPPADPDAARAALDAATDRLRAASAADAAARDRRAALDALSAEAAAEARRLAPLRAAGRRVTHLADLAAGTSAHNEYRMRLETYVLAARLEQVAAAAGVRLHRMSQGRYTLVHSDARAGGRARSGLGLHVLDAWTGRPRDTATLSGGESFVVSLALALGLADVVSGEAGGQRLDTLFIDEGFGSLDEQALDEVLDVLDGLREQDRSVGIVSHVPDLRGRVPAQLEVVKTRHGSRVRAHAAPTPR